MSDGFIPLCVPEIRGHEWPYIKECLDTNWVSSAGSYVDRFEEEFAEYVGTKHAVAMVNGTAALHVALRAVGVEAGDEVLVSTLTFIAPANAVDYRNANPVFVDAEPDYWQLEAEHVVEFLERRCERRDGEVVDVETGRRVGAVMPVHILGHPVDLEPLLEVAEDYGLPVIEDASESLGAIYRGSSVGSLGDVGCYSFNGNKIMTTGGGGMLATDDEQLAAYARYLSTQAKDDPLEYVHREVGYNYRLTNIQAAMGCAQLEELDGYVDKKRRIAATYREAFRDLPGIEAMSEAPCARSSYWLYTVRIDPNEFGMNREELHEALEDVDIQTRPLWQPIHRSPAYTDGRDEEHECLGGGDVAEALKDEALSLPCSVGLSEAEQTRVVDRVRELAGTD